MSSTTVTRGNSHETFYIGPSLTPTSVAANITAAETFNVPGLLTSDYVLVQGVVGSQTANVVIAEADVLTAGQISIQFGNTGAAAATPAAGVYVIQVTRIEGPLPANAA
jgi:hypothetical protein